MKRAKEMSEDRRKHLNKKFRAFLGEREQFEQRASLSKIMEMVLKRGNIEFCKVNIEETEDLFRFDNAKLSFSSDRIGDVEKFLTSILEPGCDDNIIVIDEFMMAGGIYISREEVTKLPALCKSDGFSIALWGQSKQVCVIFVDDDYDVYYNQWRVFQY